MRRKHMFTATGGGGHSFSSSLKAPEQTTFLGVVLEIDELWDYIKVFSFKHDKAIWLQNNLELGLNVNDIVAIEHADGSYVITQRSAIDFDYEPKRYFPESEDESKLLRDEKSKKPEYVGSRKLLYISSVAGDIIRHIGLTGYRIRDGLMHIFSGISRIAVSNLAITALSKRIVRKLSRTKSIDIFAETKEGNSYTLRIYNKIPEAGNIPPDTPDEEIKKQVYMIVCEGACAQAFAAYGARLYGVPLDLATVVYARIILGGKAREQLSYASHRYINRSLTVTPGEIHRDFHAKSATVVTKEFLEQGVRVDIGGQTYNVAAIEVESDKGERFRFANKELELADERCTVTLGKATEASFSRMVIWQDSYEHYNYPTTSAPYMLSKFYAYTGAHYMLDSYEKRWRTNTAIKINEQLLFEQDKRSGMQTFWHIVSPFTQMEGSSFFGKYTRDEESGAKPIVQYRIGDATIALGGADSLLHASGYGMRVSLGRGAVTMEGFELVSAEGVKTWYAKDATLYIDSLTMEGGLYLRGNFVVKDADFISLGADTLYAKAQKMAYLKGEHIVLNGDKSVVAVTSAQNKEGASAMYLQTGIASLYANNVAIPGYCRC